MSDQEINIAIAEACPTIVGLGADGIYYLRTGLVEFDPCNDLNAMHEAENSLRGFNSDLYANILCDLIKAGKIDTHTQKLGAPQLSWHGVFSVANATARQRAEAFLRTIGKWKEELI